jgi:acetolactate synthase-1/2/3 large subunit
VKLSDYVLTRVAQTGVRHVFFVPGGGAMHLNDSLGGQTGIEAVCNLHEQASAVAAEAYARVTGRLGVAMVTSGPGATNALTGLVGAWLDSTPCLFLSGQVKRADLKGTREVRQLGAQEVDIVSIVRSVTKYAVTVTEPSSIRYHLDKALHLATSSRTGPVWLDLPLDVQAAQVEPETMAGFTPQPSPRAAQREALTASVRRTLELLRAAERPVLLAGNGVHLARAEERFLDLVDRLGIPVLTTGLGVDLISDDHPGFAGRPGSLAPRGANFVLQNSDFLLVLGCRLDMAFSGYAPEKLARGAKKVMVDIDPAEIEKLGACIDLAIVADAADFIEEVLACAVAMPPPRQPWIERCHAWRREYPFVLPEHRKRSDGKISTYAFSEILTEECGPNDIILPGSSGFAAEIFLVAFRTKAGQRNFHNRGTGAMGLGIPAALGACLGSDRRRTVVVDGDGGFQFNVQELATVARLALPIKFFIVNNDGFASIRSSQLGYFGRLVGADPRSGLVLPDLTRVAEAYGLRAVRIGNPADLRTRIREVLDLPGPVVCEVVVAPDEPRVPRLASSQRPDGTMASRPLEDLYPFLDREELRANMLVPLLDD